MVHRKMWEWLFIAEALHEHGMLGPGHRGLGFGVGQEPLVAAFAAQGCDLVATDQPHELAVSSGWTDSSVEWAGGLEQLLRTASSPVTSSPAGSSTATST